MKFVKVASIVSAILLGGALLAGAATTVNAEPVPHCQVVTFSENSGNGPTYKHVQFCDVNSRTNYMIVDGGSLQNKAVIFGSHVKNTVTSTPLALTASSALTGIAGCWGNNGVQLGPGLIGYECINQSGPGGALYWSANEANFNWDKHPSDGLDWVEASTVHLTPDSNPVNNKHDFWVGIARTGGNFCSVINPGYDMHPTMCAFPGQPAHVMSARQQQSYDQFAQSMVAANVPDCAWSMTIESTQCDIDS